MTVFFSSALPLFRLTVLVLVVVIVIDPRSNLRQQIDYDYDDDDEDEDDPEDENTRDLLAISTFIGYLNGRHDSRATEPLRVHPGLYPIYSTSGENART